MCKRTIIVGTSSLARELAMEIRRRPRCRYTVVGFVKEEKNIRLDPFACPCLGSLEDLPCLLVECKPDHIIVATDRRYENLQLDRLTEWQTSRGITVEPGVDAYERLMGMLAIESLTASAMLMSGCFRPSSVMRIYSRLTSIVIAGFGLFLSLPFMALVALVIRLDSPGPVIFVQERVGLGGRRFKLFKFRSMHDTNIKHSEWVEDNTDRITRVGRLLRKYRLDELPQFINVLVGDMNLVGPRPHPSSNETLVTLVSRNTPLCGEEIPYYLLRSSVRPGITGWAQVRYKYANGIDEEIEKLRYDLYYIKYCSPFLELRILLKTVKVVAFGHSVPRQNASHVPVLAKRELWRPAALPGSSMILPVSQKQVHQEKSPMRQPSHLTGCNHHILDDDADRASR